MDYYDPRRRALRAVRQLLYPRECPFCGRVLGDVRDCPDCAEQLEALRRKPGIRLDPRSTISAIWPVQLRPTATAAVCGAAS